MLDMPFLKINEEMPTGGCSQNAKGKRPRQMSFCKRELLAWVVTLGLFLLLFSSCREQKVMLTQQQDSQSVHVHAGETIVLQLDENPSTGFIWEITQIDSNILTLQDSTYTQNPSKPGETGGGGTHMWTFVAKQPGTIHLQLKLWRKSQGASSSTQWYNVTLDVQQ